MRTIDALKALAVALGCVASVEKVTGNSVDEVVNFIGANLQENYKGKVAGT